MSKEKTKYCSNCGAEIDAEAEICPECGVRVERPVSETKADTKNRGLTTILALLGGFFGLWGIGHFYLGKFGKGVIFLLCGWVAALIGPVMVFGFLAFGPGGLLLGILGAFAWLAGWLLQTYDAHKLAGKYNSYIKKHGEKPW